MTLPTASPLANSDFRPSFLQLAVVNVLSNLMVPLAGLVNLAFLGHLADIRHLAGVALATILFDYIYWTFGFLRMGTTGTTAQALGRGDRDGIWLTGLRNSLIALALGTAILLLQVPLREAGFALLSATPAVKASGIAYYNALIWGAPATLLNFVFIGWFLGQRLGAQVFLLSLVNNVTTVGLNYLLIVRWGWESAGAGWATALSQYFTLLTGLFLVSRFLEWGRIKAIAPHLWNGAALKAAFLLNRDILIRTFALVSTFALFTNLGATLGTTTLASNTLLLEIVTLAAYFIDGFAFATESYAGVFHGQGARSQLIMLVQLAGGISLALGILFALLTDLFPDSLFRLLTSHTEISTQVHDYVLWLFPVLGCGSIAYMLDGYFLGLTQGKILRQSALIAALVGLSRWQRSPGTGTVTTVCG
jgi:MATE family multidrug resistance protein